MRWSSSLTATLALLSQAGSVSALWPIPASYSLGTTALWIGRDVKVEVITAAGASNVGTMTLFEQEQNPLMAYDPFESLLIFPLLRYLVFSKLSNSTNSTSSPSDEIIGAAVQKTHETIFNHGYIPWRFHTRNSKFEPDASTNGTKAVKSITLVQKNKDSPNVLKPAVNEVDESYRLQLTVDGKVTITANSSIGIARGLTTFSQLFFAHTAGGSYTPYAPVDVTDFPHFGHRGLNMDLSRAYFPPKDIRKTIDALAFNKYNRLHLHITDSQSWPLVIPSMPELSAKGAYRANLVYDKSTLEELQRYGALHGVEVFLEIDMPGHTSSIAYSHPELIASFNIQPDWGSYAAEPPSGTLKLNSSAVTSFVEKLFADLLPRVSPYTTYMHTGGDEVNANAYTNDETVKSNDTDVITPLMQKFIDHSHDVVRKAGLTPMVWEEMLLQWNLTLGKDVIVQTWRSDEAVAQTVKSGYKTLVGNYNYWVRLSNSTLEMFTD
jgi:hexosaminidase